MKSSQRSTFRRAIVGAFAAAATFAVCLAAQALVVESTAGTNVAPVDDPGWANVSNGSRDYVYLGDGWALSARHIGPSPSQISNPTFGETLNFAGNTFGYIPGQAFYVPNPCYGTAGCITPDSQYTDLQLVRIDGDPGLPSLTIASQQITNSTPIDEREVMIIGRGKPRNANLSYWNAVQVAGNNPANDEWTAGTAENHTNSGYNTSGAEVKRWGMNQIADEAQLEGINDTNLRLLVTYALSAGPTNVISMITKFDPPNPGVIPESEAQAVSGDSGSAVFHKRDGNWELIGIVNGVGAPIVPGSSPATPFDRLPNTTAAVYGMHTFFADLSYYHDAIQGVMTQHANYSLLGDINLDATISGFGDGAWENDDFAAFASGWGYDNGTGVGTITSWKNGDLNRDGKTDATDYDLLANAIVLPGDYNDDGVVDASDYSTWRNALGESITLPNETLSIGSVTQDDYNVWRQNYGLRIPTLEELVGSGNGGIAVPGGPVSGGVVPEPASLLMILAGPLVALLRRRPRQPR